MNLPEYFLADLPPGAELTGSMITEACLTLRRNREAYLLTRSTQSLVELLSAVAERWLEPRFHIRRFALEAGPGAAGFSRETLERGLDSFFRQLNPQQLGALIEQDLGHKQRLEKIVSTTLEERQSRGAIARGPDLLVQIAAGNLPNPAFLSMALGVLLRSAQFIKCASGSAFLPRLFAHSIYDEDRKLGSCLEVAEWRGGNSILEDALFAQADCVTATGNDVTLASIRARLPVTTRFVGYGHRVSLAYVAKEVLTTYGAPKVAAHAAADVAAWNQLGCLSPHVVYVEAGAVIGADQFAEMIAAELAQRETIEPRGPVSTEVAATIASRRSFYEVRAAHSPDTRCWCSEGSTAWTVIYEADPRFQLSCLNRFVYVKPVPHLKGALEAADAIRRNVSTVGLAAADGRDLELASELARWGATRVCPIGAMQHPPLSWRHDGQPALGDLVTWTDFET
jgi:hypothetical protein